MNCLLQVTLTVKHLISQLLRHEMILFMNCWSKDSPSKPALWHHTHRRICMRLSRSDWRVMAFTFQKSIMHLLFSTSMLSGINNFLGSLPTWRCPAQPSPTSRRSKRELNVRAEALKLPSVITKVSCRECSRRYNRSSVTGRTSSSGSTQGRPCPS